MPGIASTPAFCWAEEIAAADASAGDAISTAHVRLARFTFFEKSGVAVIKVLEFKAGNFLTDKSFDGENVA